MYEKTSGTPCLLCLPARSIKGHTNSPRLSLYEIRTPNQNSSDRFQCRGSYAPMHVKCMNLPALPRSKDRKNGIKDISRAWPLLRQRLPISSWRHLPWLQQTLPRLTESLYLQCTR
jgi:hypothetical protein